MGKVTGDRIDIVRQAVRILATEALEKALEHPERVALGYDHTNSGKVLTDAKASMFSRISSCVDTCVLNRILDACDTIYPGVVTERENYYASTTLHKLGGEAGRRGMVQVLEAALRLARQKETEPLPEVEQPAEAAEAVA